MTDKTVISTEIKNLLPKDDFKKIFHQDYEFIYDVFAENVLKKLPKDHSIETIEGHLFIIPKEPALEGYDKFVRDAQRVHTGQDDRVSFAGYLENFINATGRNAFFK